MLLVSRTLLKSLFSFIPQQPCYSIDCLRTSFLSSELVFCVLTLTHNSFTTAVYRGVEKAFQRFYKDENIKTSVGYTGGADNNPDYKKVLFTIT